MVHHFHLNLHHKGVYLDNCIVFGLKMPAIIYLLWNKKKKILCPNLEILKVIKNRNVGEMNVWNMLHNKSGYKVTVPEIIK